MLRLYWQVKCISSNAKDIFLCQIKYLAKRKKTLSIFPHVTPDYNINNSYLPFFFIFFGLFYCIFSKNVRRLFFLLLFFSQRMMLILEKYCLMFSFIIEDLFLGALTWFFQASKIQNRFVKMKTWKQNKLLLRLWLNNKRL